jgi:multidrug efflux pump subunit AcrB
MTAFWKFFLDKHQFTVLLSIVLLISGIYAVEVLPKESTPAIDIPIGIVTTVVPGASSADMERLVTDKIEDGVLGIEHVSKVTSTSADGVSNVSVEFDASADIDKSLQLLRDAVDKVRPDLPSDAVAPVVTGVNFSNQPIIIASVAGNLAPAELTALGKTLEDDLKRVPGVSSVSLSGVRGREVQVLISQAKLAEYGLTVGSITNAISGAGLATPLGSITVDNVSYNVRFDAGVTDPSQIAAVSLQGPGGVPLTLSSVADVVDGLENPTTDSRVSTAGMPSQPSLTLSVFKGRGGNIIATGNAVKAELATLQKTTLAGTNVVVTVDAANIIAKDLSDLTKTGLETVALVLIILFLTLGWRESLAAAASIPLSFLIAFIGMYASGNSLNVVSLFSLILAIGILVDSGIVVVEAIHTRLESAGSRKAAAVAAIEEYAWPLFAGTFTTIGVFVPLFFLSGILGKFIASIPFTVIFVLLASIFVALGIVPLLAVYLVRPQKTRLSRLQEHYSTTARHWYATHLRAILRNKRSQNIFIGVLVALFVVSLTLPAIGVVHSIFFPQNDSDLIYIQLEKPQGTDLAVTDLSAREVEEVLYADKDIASFVTETGAGSALAGQGGAGGSASNIGNVTINLKTPRQKTSLQIITELRAKLAPITSARITVGEPNNGPSSTAPIHVSFSGDDLGALSTAVERANQVLADIPGTTNIETSTKDASSEFVVTLDTAKASSAGVSPGAVAQTLRTALFGTKATTLRIGSSDVDVYTKLVLNPTYSDPSETTHVSIDAVRALLIPGTNGSVPLSAIATISYGPSQNSITHENGTRIVSLDGDVTSNTTAVQVTSAFTKAMSKIALPAGVMMTIGGESADVSNSFTQMGIALLAGIALMLGVLMLEFNSIRQSLYLLSIIPLSLIGVFAGLALTGAPLSFPSMLGVIALAGVIINHAIILMDSIARIAHEHPELSHEEVVVEASSIRFRPILLTTVVTVVGMIPLSFASALWGPLAFAIMFGLSFSLILTLLFVPILYFRWPGKHAFGE